MKNQPALITIICALLILFLAPSVYASSSILVTEDGESHMVRTMRVDGREYVSVNDLASILNAEIYWHRMLRKVALEFGDHQVVFTWFSPYMLYDSEVYNLTYDTMLREGTLYVPLPGFQRIWDYIHTPRSPDEREIVVRGEFSIVDVSIEEKVNGILMEIFLTQPLEYEIFRDQNGNLNVNFYQGKLNPMHFGSKKAPGLLRWIKAYQFENSAQLSFRLTKPFVGFSHALKKDPYRIQISLARPSSSQDASDLVSDRIPADEDRLLDDLIDVIVIDPGHGGPDSGAVGRSGLLEKEVTLDIAKRLQELLMKEEGFKVILTRETDVLVPLEERTQIANRSGADLFISIHTNSFKKRSVRGSQTFFLAAAKNDEARAAAALENSSVRFDLTDDDSHNVADLEFILMELVQSEYLKESSDLAAMIQKRLRRRLPIPSRGVSQAGFVVLNKAYMPAVLVETAFISNRKDEKLLKKGSFRQKTAEAVLQSVRDFKRKYESAQ
ncbi:MAG: N-acetylmuramoyl-L-alanine amidase [Candidatus Zixiibacteriota bacterium]|nr:MAG: N-acetylmuramoyl-L-alanine amidase [candidate division Zixibacteria bacterium]